MSVSRPGSAVAGPTSLCDVDMITIRYGRTHPSSLELNHKSDTHTHFTSNSIGWLFYIQIYSVVSESRNQVRHVMARDRTPEFRATLSSIRNRTRTSIAPVNGSIPIGSGHDSAKQNLLLNGDGRGSRGVNKEGQRSEFARMAGQISKDLTLTMGKLQKLAQRMSHSSVSLSFR